MAEKLSKKEIQTALNESIDKITELIKAAFQQNRLAILTSMIDGPKKFAFLLENNEISKTALSNHIRVLLDTGLIEKLERGNYGISKDGLDFLRAVVYVFKESEIRKEAEREHLKKEYSRFYRMEKKIMEEFILDNPPVYQPAWISYLSTTTGVLKSLGVDCDVDDVGGRTGYSFIVHVSKGTTCPSGPTAMNDSTWKEIHLATESFGWKFKVISDNKSYPQREGELSDEDLLRARKFFEQVKKVIKQKKTPAIIWGIPVPEYGIVYGIKDDSYIVSTFRTLNKIEEKPIKFTDLQAPGCLHLFYFEDKKEGDQIIEDKNSLRRAIKMAKGIDVAHDGYIAGPNAYDEWASVLEEGKEESFNLHGNSYYAECYHEGKAIAKEYLKRLAEKYDNKPQTEYLNKASIAYAETETSLGKFQEIFPFSRLKDIELTPKNRIEGSNYLLKAKSYELKAIEYMEKALQKWI